MADSNRNHKEDLICPLPWLHEFININGDYQICCTADGANSGLEDHNQKQLKASDRPDVNELLNCQSLKEIRKTFLSGVWPKTCERCRLSEISGGYSRRLSELKRHHVKMDTLLKRTDSQGVLSNPEVVSMDLRLGNVCNLSCRMCSPVASSKWVSEWQEQDYKWFSPNNEQLQVYSWPKNKNILENISNHMHNINHLHFGGGEPLYIGESFQLLKYCIEKGFSKNIRLSYNTNLSELPAPTKELWPEFKHVDLMVSIDGLGPINDYIRSGSRFEKINENLKNIDKHFASYNLNEVSLMCTVQVYNLFHLSEIFDYCKKFKNISPFPELIPLYMPDELSIQQFDAENKERATKEINEIKSFARKVLSSLPEKKALDLETRLRDLDEILEFLNTEPEKDLRSQLKAMTLSLDKSKKYSLKEVAPKLHHWIINQPDQSPSTTGE